MLNNRITIARVAAACACVAALNIFWFSYIASEHTIYDWDFYVYWAKCATLADTFMSSPVAYARTVVSSIRYDEFTALPVAPTAIIVGAVERLHSLSARSAYVLTTGNLYLLPALVLLGWLVAGIERGDDDPWRRRVGDRVWLAVVLTALLTPALWLPLLRGYSDVGGLWICFLIAGLYLRWRQTPASYRLDVAVWSAIVVLMTALALFRRWYVYWIVWFWIGVGVSATLAAWGEWRAGRGLSLAIRRFLVMGLAGCGLCVVLFIVSPAFVHRLFENYSDIYAAYHLSHSFGAYLVNTFSVLGIAALALFAVAAVYGYVQPSAREAVVLLTVQMAGTVVHFSRTEDFASHHRYLLLASILPITGWFVARWLPALKWRLAVPVAAVGIFAHLLSFTPIFAGIPEWVPLVVGRVDGQPLERRDLTEWRRLASSVDGLLRADGEGPVYVLASSYVFNPTHLQSLNLSLGEHYRAPQLVATSSEVDRWHGFPAQLLRAKYVLAAEPVQLHLALAEQQVIAVPLDELRRRSGIGAAFAPSPQTFALDGGVTVTVYERTRPSTPDEIRQLSDELRRAHPRRPNVYESGVGLLSAR